MTHPSLEVFKISGHHNEASNCFDASIDVVLMMRIKILYLVAMEQMKLIELNLIVISSKGH